MVEMSSLIFDFPDVAVVCLLSAVPLVWFLTTAISACVFLRNPPAGREWLMSLGFGILVVAILPNLYLHARGRHDVARLAGFLEQSRFGEAKALIRDLIRLAPSTEYQGRRLSSIEPEIDSQIRELESRLAKPVAESASPEEILERCRRMAMLARTDEALRALGPLLDTPVSPAACDLCGTIYEATSQWKTARDYHRRAKEEWLGRLPTSERTAGIVRSATRLGYCERKLGNVDLAEAEYREALALSPTADMHFLLAQFYEDVQQSAKARAHARRAMALAPQRFQRAGANLIDKLTVGHFGCLGVYMAESGERVSPYAVEAFR